MSEFKVICTGCNKTPDELDEYINQAKSENDKFVEYVGRPPEADEAFTPTSFVQELEGTYNSHNGHFLCTECYIKAGMPSGPRGWVAP